MMQQVKEGFTVRRNAHTRAFFMESRIMTESYPGVYSPERPYSRGAYRSKKKTSEPPKHVYKLMGALYRQNQPKPKDEAPKKPDYKTVVLTNEEKSAKKCRSASQKARKTEKAIT